MTGKTFSVLFLCTGNSARSIIAEAILNRIGRGSFRAHSAGSHPKGQVNPNALRLLQGLGYDVSGYRSKSWDEFALPGTHVFDFIFTVCDDAAGVACPAWPRKPVTAHWGVPDPAAAEGSPVEIAAAFNEAYRQLFRRIELFCALPLSIIGRMALETKLREIGRIDGATLKALA